MRLSAELIGSSEQRTNALGEREIVMRGLAIPAIEHLGVTRDAFDSIDLTDNRLEQLENLPRLLRLASLHLAGNVIQSVDVNNLSKNAPNLTHINLSHNQISSLYQVSSLGKACPKLQVLNLHGNPVTRRQHYRLYTIKQIPSLKVLDFSRITQSERSKAERLASSAAGAALEADVQGEANNSNTTSKTTKTFTPGEGSSAKESFVTSFTKEEKELIRQAVANASSPAEIEEIERSVQRGVLPPGLASKKRPAEEEATAEEEENGTTAPSTTTSPAAKKTKIDNSTDESK